MNHADHVRLLKKGVPHTGGRWADFGSGDGAFTLALADLLGPAAEIHSVDSNAGALARQRRAVSRAFPEVMLHTYNADFTTALDLPLLDGLVVANALHFYSKKEPVVKQLMAYLRPGAAYLIVEYDTDRGNRWVPHPFSFGTWLKIAHHCGLQNTMLLARTPSSFLGSFYCAASNRSRPTATN
jgi:ubiquinone/menaquinone biosynthesis C-methylase UbiE